MSNVTNLDQLLLLLFFGSSIAITSSDGISISSPIVIVSAVDLKSSSIMAAKGSFKSIIFFKYP